MHFPGCATAILTAMRRTGDCGCHGIRGKFFLSGSSEREKYKTFFTEELPLFIRNVFPVSREREKTFIAGFSMGGYGAWYLALSRPELYAKAASMSGALDIAGLYQAAAAGNNDNNPFHWEDCFGDPDKLAGSDYDLFTLYDRDVKNGCVPKLYQAVGRDDFCIRRMCMSESCWNRNRQI